MKQIIVNVAGLTIEEKLRMNEALAKITGACKMLVVHPEAAMFFAPNSLGENKVSWDHLSPHETPTHTPQQVLEMAGMAEKCKVREDFDLTKEYSVDVSNCTKDEKKKVQQAFFDAGFPWEYGGKKFQYLDAAQYSNTTGNGHVTTFCMFGRTTKECNMNPEEFFSYVYEPVQQGHPHADLMVLYAEDAKTTDKPWELWQVYNTRGVWHSLIGNPPWRDNVKYRRKPKTHIVNGVEVPDLRFEPKENEKYYMPNPIYDNLCGVATRDNYAAYCHRASNALCYEYTEEGRKAAILHAKAMLGIDPNSEN